MKVQLNSAVYNDLREIMEHYDEVASGDIASTFYTEFRLYADRAVAMPKSYPIYSDSPEKIRRVNFRRFPYHFLFRQIDKNTIRILVVRHDHRHPSYGMDRW